MRRKLWPLMHKLTDSLEMDWTELQNLYEHYQKQWQAILPDQELRFTAYRERKNLIGTNNTFISSLIIIRLSRTILNSFSITHL